MSCKDEHVSDKVKQTRRQSLEQVMGLSLRSLTALPASHFPAPRPQSPLGNKLVLAAQTFQPAELWEDARSLIFSVRLQEKADESHENFPERPGQQQVRPQG